MTGVESPRGPLPQIAVLGAGHVGPVIARVAMDAGYHATLSASGDPEKIALITQVLAPTRAGRRGRPSTRHRLT